MANLNMSDRVVEKLISFLAQNEYVRELDISWSDVRQVSLAKLSEALALNKRLRYLVLPWNSLLEENEQNKLNESRTTLRQKPKLTEKN